MAAVLPVVVFVGPVITFLPSTNPAMLADFAITSVAPEVLMIESVSGKLGLYTEGTIAVLAYFTL